MALDQFSTGPAGLETKSAFSGGRSDFVAKPGALVWVWDLEDPTRGWMSPEFLALVGRAEDVARRPCGPKPQVVHPDDLAVLQLNMRRMTAARPGLREQMLRCMHADGSVIWTRSQSNTVRSRGDRPARVVTTLVPFAALNREQTMLVEENTRLNILVQTVSSAIFGLTAERQIAIANPAARHLLGGVSAPLPLNWPRHIRFMTADGEDALERDADPLARALAGERIDGETHLMTRAGRDDLRYVRVSSQPVEEGDDCVRAVLVFEDISEDELRRQQMERAARMDALGLLTGGIAHDFNNLLATMTYALDMSLEHDLPTPVRANLERAQFSVRRGTELTRRLLGFARRRPGQAQARKVAQIFEDLQALTRKACQEDIVLDFACANADLSIFCDQAQLENALLNLILNSRDAILGARRGDRIVIHGRALPSLSHGACLHEEAVTKGLADVLDCASDPEGEIVEITVTDNGPGMAPEIMDRAFDPFFTTKDSQAGTGLGLAMAKGFVESEKGIIWLYSTPDRGTSVSLRLPRGRRGAVPSDTGEDRRTPEGRGETVLLVEDEKTLLEMTRLILETLGYRVVTAPSVADASRKIAEGLVPDLLLTDVVLPGPLGGFDLARMVREKFPKLPVIYMSGYTGFAKAEMGPVDAPLLPKPCSTAKLARTVRRSLSDEMA